MSIAVTAYEFYGPPDADPVVVSANRATIGDLSLKAITDPSVLYYGHDIQRPLFGTNFPYIANSMPRYVAFQITGAYDKIKNVKITLTKPLLYNKVGGVFTAVAGDDTQMMYKLTPEYAEAETQNNYFGVSGGKYDGTMSVILGGEVLRPRLSTVSPLLATTRKAEYIYAPSYWTEFIVIQATVFPGAYDKVGSFGKQGGEDLGSITGPLLTIQIDEVGVTTVT